MKVCVVLPADMRYQKINHFPGMNEICRKDLLARNLNRMLKLFPKDYSIFPRTWCLPADYSDFLAYARAKKHKTYICKPESGCQGRGIFLTKSNKDIRPGEHMICQVYISKPFLIDGFKFDLRIYVLVTSCDPFRIFVYNEGLARFCTNQYSEPTHNTMDDVCMHLTNYAINKHSENFVHDDDQGSKRNEELRQAEAARMEQMQRYEANHLGGFRPIYPTEGEDKYEKYFQQSSSLFQETVASKAREDCSRQQLQELRLKQEQKERKHKGKQKDLQGESAGERAKSRKVQTYHMHTKPHSEQESMPLPTLTGGTSLYLELSKEEEAEEVERVNALLQRKNLLRDLGVVDLVYELLHSIHSQPGPTKVLHKQVNVSLPKTRESISQLGSLTELWRHKLPCTVRQRIVPPGDKPCQQYLHSRLMQHCTPLTILDWRPRRPVLSEPTSFQHIDLETKASDVEWQELPDPRRAASAHRVARTIISPVARQGSIRSCFVESRNQAPIMTMQQLGSRQLCCSPMSSEHKALQNLFVVSTSAPLVPRPGHSYTFHKGHFKNFQQGQR
ncbi:tubulin polyglutamylase ttll6 isoform X1 [Tachysurus ichikawai]